MGNADLPKPNYLLNTSPDKWQAVWKVHQFAKDEAEHLQQALARDMGADPAATDCARVLRLPGFSNHKYNQPFQVTVQAYSVDTYGWSAFPIVPTRAKHRQK